MTPSPPWQADIRHGSVQRYRSRWHLQGVAGDAADDEADSAAANGELDRLARTFSRRLLLHAAPVHGGRA